VKCIAQLNPSPLLVPGGHRRVSTQSDKEPDKWGGKRESPRTIWITFETRGLLSPRCLGDVQMLSRSTVSFRLTGVPPPHTPPGLPQRLTANVLSHTVLATLMISFPHPGQDSSSSLRLRSTLRSISNHRVIAGLDVQRARVKTPADVLLPDVRRGGERGGRGRVERLQECEESSNKFEILSEVEISS